MKSKNKKRILALVLSMVLMLSTGISAMAEGETPEQTGESKTVEQQEAAQESQGDASGAAKTQGEKNQEIEQETETAAQTETTEEITEELVSEAADLYQDFKDEDGNVVTVIHAYVPEGAFQAKADQISMEAKLLDKESDDYIKSMIQNQLPENSYLGGYVLYEVNFLVDGVITEPAKAITLTIEGSGLRVTDLNRTRAFRYDPADLNVEEDQDELIDMGQKADVLTYLADNGVGEEQISEYEYAELDVQNETANQIGFNTWKSTIYGCYTEAYSAETEFTQEVSGTTVKVTAPEGAFPMAAEEVSFTAAEITEEQENVISGQLEEKAGELGQEVKDYAAYDLSFTADGEEIQPQVPVTVSFENTGLSAEDVNGGQGFWLDEENGTVSDVEGTMENGTASMTLEQTGAAGCWTYGDEEVQKEEDSAAADDSQTDAELTEEEMSEGTVEEQKENETELEEADEQEDEQKDDPAEEDEEQKNENNEDVKVQAESDEDLANRDEANEPSEMRNENKEVSGKENSDQKASPIENSISKNNSTETNKKQSNTSEQENSATTLRAKNWKDDIHSIDAPSGWWGSSPEVTEEEYNNALSQMQSELKSTEDGNIPITGWKRASDGVAINKTDGNDNMDWKWNGVINQFGTWLENETEIWDGSRTTEHNFTKYLNRNNVNRVTMLDGKLYDSATWEKGTRGDATLYRFQGTFDISEYTDELDNYSFTLKQVIDDEKIYINDDIYVFVYPEGTEIDNNNFKNYLAFWTGSVNGNGGTGQKFNGIEGTRSYWGGSTYQGYGFPMLTDNWRMDAVDDNIGPRILQGYEETKSTKFVVDMFVDDFADGGGTYRLKLEAKEKPRADIKITKVDEEDHTVKLQGAEFQVRNSENTTVLDNVKTDNDGILKLPLTEGTYTLTETKAPEGYITNNTSYIITVDQNGKVTSTTLKTDREGYYIENHQDPALQKRNVEFTKINTKQVGVSGAQFVLKSGDSIIQTQTSGEDGQVKFSDVSYGTYVMEETQAPATYVKPDVTWTVVVNSSGSYIYEGAAPENPGSSNEGLTQIINYTKQEETEKKLQYDKWVTDDEENGRDYTLHLTADSLLQTAGEEGDNASVVLVLDKSGSMGNSFYALKKAAKSFVEQMGEKSNTSEIAVVYFGSENKTSSSEFQTLDQKGIWSLERFIDDASSGGNTYMNEGLQKAEELLTNATNKNQYVVFFTDGEPQGPGTGEPKYRTEDNKIANEAKEAAKRIKEYATIYAVGYGSVQSADFWWYPGNATAKWYASYNDSWHEGQGWKKLGAAEYLKSYIASDISKYSYANTESAIEEIFKSIAGEVAQGLSIQANKIVDVIDPRFELTDQTKQKLNQINEQLVQEYGQGDYITINDNTEDGSTIITWNGPAALIKPKESENKHGWQYDLEITAKDDFIGGNMIPTNGAGSGIHIDKDNFVEFPKPTANVKLLNLNLEDKEETFFLGDTITIDSNLYKEILETLTMEDNQSIPNLGLDNLRWQDASNGSNQKTAALDYSYTNTEGQQDVIGTFHFTFEPIVNRNLDSHLADQVGQNVEQYKMTVTYTSKTVGERQEQINSSDSYTDPAGDALTAGNGNNPIQVQADGKYVINVVAGSIQIKKILDKKGNPAIEGDPIFTFKIEYTPFSGTESKVYYRTIRFTGEESAKDAELLDGLPKGIYKVTELATQKYKLESVSAQDSSDGIAQVNNSEKSVTFTFGADEATNRLTATKGVAAYTNTKTGPSTNTDTDTVVNRFEYNEKTNSWEFKQIFIPGEGQKLENKN